MARDFEDHCWKDVIDPDTLRIYQAYHRRIYVGDNPAVLAIDLYNKAYLGGNRPVKEVDQEFSGSCGEHAWKAMPPTQRLFAAARQAGVPVIYSTRHVDTGGVQSTNRNIKDLGKDIYESRDFSEGTARLIDEEVQRLLRESDQRAFDLLVAHRAELEKLVDALVQDEEMDREEVEKLLGITKPLATPKGKLEAEVITVKVGGRTVEVCCEDCATALKEAQVSTATKQEG